MADFGLRNDKKYCKYNWCPISSPRTRSKSESISKCIELKSLSNHNRRYTLSHEHENILMANDMNNYTPKGPIWRRQTDYYRSKTRTNLCELPTTYISSRSNCQTMPNLLKNEELKPKIEKSIQLRQTHINNVNEDAIAYDTRTFFDKMQQLTNTAPSGNLQERYNLEIQMLREKLQRLKRSNYNNNENDLNVEKKKSIRLKSGKSIAKSKVSIRINNNKSKFGQIRLNKTKSKFYLKSNVISDTIQSDESDYITSDESEIINESSGTSEEINDEKIDIFSHHMRSDRGDYYYGWPLRASEFPYVPPYIRFNPHNYETSEKLPRKLFKWKLSTITPILVRKTLINSGFLMVRSEFSRESNQWIGTWGKHMKSPMFKTLKENQKLNHFPGTFQLGRKDRLWRNFQKMMNQFGYNEFGFLPYSFILPQELRLLKHNWQFKNGNGGEMWIIKPPAAARGVGIKVINKWCQLPKKQSLVVQKYITNPYLINGSKFDLRLYLLVTSFHPLRIYLYPDGLARFASTKYSEDENFIKDRYMHLTNYSINKFSQQYTANEDANSCQGHKWTLMKLFEYLQQNNGVNISELWQNLQDLCVKTIITAESYITELCEENLNTRYNCYELFGIDVLLDDKLKAWLLEVNISPSLHSSSPLDEHVKGPLVQTLFDLAQFHVPGNVSTSRHKCFDPRLYTVALTKRERDKHNNFEQYEKRCDYLNDILTHLTGDDVRHLIQAEDEFMVKGQFQRIFPTSRSYKYLNFLPNRYYNRLFDAWEVKYEKNRQEGKNILRELCLKKVHLKVAPQLNVSKSGSNLNNPGDQKGTISNSELLSTTLNKLDQDSKTRPLTEIIQQVSINEDNYS